MKPPDEPATAALPKRRVLKECQARDENTGRKCTLLEHAGHDHNASGRKFTFALRPGMEPRRELDKYAGTRNGDALDTTACVTAGDARATVLHPRGPSGGNPADQKKWAARQQRLRAAQESVLEQLVTPPTPEAP